MSSDRNVTNHGNMGIKRTVLISIIDIFCWIQDYTPFHYLKMRKTPRPKFPLYFWQTPFVKSRVLGQGEGGVRQFYFWYPWVPITQWNTKTCWCILISNFWFFWDGLVYIKYIAFLICPSFHRDSAKVIIKILNSLL